MGINREQGNVAHVAYRSFPKLFVPVSLTQAGPQAPWPRVQEPNVHLLWKKNGDFISFIPKKYGHFS